MAAIAATCDAGPAEVVLFGTAIRTKTAVDLRLKTSVDEQRFCFSAEELEQIIKEGRVHDAS